MHYSVVTIILHLLFPGWSSFCLFVVVVSVFDSIQYFWSGRQRNKNPAIFIIYNTINATRSLSCHQQLCDIDWVRFIIPLILKISLCYLASLGYIQSVYSSSWFAYNEIYRVNISSITSFFSWCWFMIWYPSYCQPLNNLDWQLLQNVSHNINISLSTITLHTVVFDFLLT